MSKESIRVLVIEDDTNHVRLVQAYLERSKHYDYEMMSRHNAASGIACISDNDFDVVLLDLGLPDSKGLETLQSIQSLRPGLPVVIHSALADEAIAIEAVKCGAQDYLVKGQATGEVMTRALNYAIERKRAAEELHKAHKQLQETHEKLKASQEQLIQAEKMSAIGTMVAGVAHELNNPLTAIIQFARYCGKFTDTEDSRYEILQDIVHEGQRCAAIVRDLLTFSTMGEPEDVESQDCNTILDRVLNLIRYRVENENVTLSRDIPESLPLLQVKVNEIQQVLLNLITNALDAVRSSDRKEINISVRPEGRHMQITITDTGIGIPGESLNRIFDPFYTTKPPGRGTGLGLTVTRNIVNPYGGEIYCQSDPGNGTRIVVTLPAE